MFARIVLAYDGSKGAHRALTAAADLAAEMGSEVVVVSVEDHLPHYGATVGEVDEERAFEQRIAQRCLNEASARLDEAGVKARTEIRAGHPVGSPETVAEPDVRPEVLRSAVRSAQQTLAGSGQDARSAIVACYDAMEHALADAGASRYRSSHGEGER